MRTVQYYTIIYIYIQLILHIIGPHEILPSCFDIPKLSFALPDSVEWQTSLQLCRRTYGGFTGVYDQVRPYMGMGQNLLPYGPHVVLHIH